MKIGELAKKCDIPVKTIRYYEEERIFLPSEVDRWTGYRNYNDANVKKLLEIKFLRNMGFSIKEIKSFNEDSFNEKIKQYKKQILSLQKNIFNLQHLSKNEKGDFNMKTFINDERVIGKWKLVGFVKEKRDIVTDKWVKSSEDYAFDEIYFLPNGEEYWALSWTKGILYICDRANPYEIIEGKLIVGITDCKTKKIIEYMVFKQMDKKVYKKEDIKKEDNIDLPFINDDEFIGVYKSVAFVKDVKDFDDKKKNNDLFWDKLIVMKNGESIMQTKESVFTIKWTKNYLINEMNKTVSKYKKIIRNGKEFYAIEWKSGDYTFGGKVTVYYIFEKQN